LPIFRYNSKTGADVWALVRVNDELLYDEIAIPAPVDSRAFEARIQDAPFINTNNAQGVAAGRAGRVPGDAGDGRPRRGV